MTDRSSITQEFVKECFDYVDGKLIWKQRPIHHFQDEWRQRIFNSRQAGSVAGTLISGYQMVNFVGRRMSVHRLVFLWHHGFLPDELDHIDRNPLNNRIENLRPASHSDNCKNRSLYASNTSGFKGVSFHKSSGKWSASIRIGNKSQHLGLFKDINEAVSKRRDAELLNFGEFANG
jgi:hypothetical protein